MTGVSYLLRGAFSYLILCVLLCVSATVRPRLSSPRIIVGGANCQKKHAANRFETNHSLHGATHSAYRLRPDDGAVIVDGPHRQRVLRCGRGEVLDQRAPRVGAITKVARQST